MNNPRISINLLRWRNEFDEIKECIDAILAQDYPDFLLYYSDNHGNDKTLIEQVKAAYGHDQRLRIMDNGSNIGYAPGHNRFFEAAETELVMPINPDAIMTKGFLREIIKIFDDAKVGMATGKMLKPEANEKGEHLIDGTGIVIDKYRRGKERGQLEIDHGQYDNQRDVFGVSGTAAVYRKQALEEAKVDGEYFDTDFFAYWEDLDLSWRLRLAGYEAKYVPEAVIYHSRVAGASPGGYKKVFSFIKHHATLSLNVRRWNWRNHLFTIIKNDFGWNMVKGLPFTVLREAAMFGYILIFEPRTLGALPAFFKLLPKMLRKRKIVQAKRKVTSKEISKWFK